MASGTTQFNYVLDSKSGLEYWIFGYSAGRLGDRPEALEQYPYGTMLTAFLDMDTGLVSALRDTLSRFVQVDSVETYVRRWPDIKDDIWKMTSVTEALPVMLTDLVGIYGFYIKEYMADPATRPYTKAEIDRLVRGAQIIKEHCDTILARHARLSGLIHDGRFSGARRPPREVLESLGAEVLDALTDCTVQGHCVLLDKDGREEMALCFDAGVDLTAFLTVVLTDIIGGGMEITLCQHCGKPFISAGRAIYCDRPTASGSTCRAVGATSKYTKSLEENPAVGRYRRAYKRHYARLMKGTVTRADFEGWRDTAKETLNAHLSGQVTEVELERALNSEF